MIIYVTTDFLSFKNIWVHKGDSPIGKPNYPLGKIYQASSSGGRLDLNRNNTTYISRDCAFLYYLVLEAYNINEIYNTSQKSYLLLDSLVSCKI